AGLERFPLLGLSQGCAVAIAYAVRHPERVSRLVLYGGYLKGIVARARTPQEREEAELLKRRMPSFRGRDNPAFRLLFALPIATPQIRSKLIHARRSTRTPSRSYTTSASTTVATR